MKNFPIKDPKTGKEWWISRAMAVVGIITASDPHKLFKHYFLVSKRGSGSPDHVGKWQCTCGYLDWDETLEEAVKREVLEETGLDLNNLPDIPDSNLVIKLLQVIDDPKQDARQNVSFRYMIHVPYEVLIDKLKSGEINCDTVSRGGEANEISEIRLIEDTEIDNYEWAFNHKDLLKSLI